MSKRYRYKTITLSTLADWIWAKIGKHAKGKGISVAVIDTGIEKEHPIFQGQIMGGIGIKETKTGKLRFDKNFKDDSGHGTSVAGIIHAIAPEAEIYGVKVLDFQGKGSGETLIKGLKWAINKGVHIVNLSCITDSKYYLKLMKLAEEAYYRNIILTASAAHSKKTSYPAVFSSVIGVGWREGNFNKINFIYQPRQPIELSGAGPSLYVPWLNGKYRYLCGPSLEAAKVSGMVTLLLSLQPFLTPFQVKVKLLELTT